MQAFISNIARLSFLITCDERRYENRVIQSVLHVKEKIFKRANPPESNTANQVFISTAKFSQLKRTALRRRIWFRALNALERGLFDLTLRYVDNIRSPKLAKILTAIIEKLQQTMENTLDKLTRTIGAPLAQKISNIAVNWGNKTAKNWASDQSFAVFLAITHKNT